MSAKFWLFCKVGFCVKALCALQMCQNVRWLLKFAVTYEQRTVANRASANVLGLLPERHSVFRQPNIAEKEQ